MRRRRRRPVHHLFSSLFLAMKNYYPQLPGTKKAYHVPYAKNI